MAVVPNTDSIFCPLPQDWFRLIPIIMKRKLLIIHLESLPAVVIWCALSPLHWVSTSSRPRIEFLCLFSTLLIFLSVLTWTSDAPWLSIPLFFCVWITLFLSKFSKNTGEYNNLSVWARLGIIPRLYCHAGASWCNLAHLLGNRRSENDSESKHWGLVS